MGKLTQAHMAALGEASNMPFYGFPAGSNVWSLTTLDPDGIAVDGEVVDELLREGLLVATPTGTVVAGERSPDHDYVPDLDFEYVITITPAGRDALAEIDNDK